MYQKDYILRLIEEAAKALRIILSLEKEEKYEEAMAIINESFTNLLDIDIDEFKRMDTKYLIPSLIESNGFDIDKFNIAVDLLIESSKCSTNVYEKQNVLLKAKQLLDYLNYKDKTYSFERINKIKFIMDELSELKL